MMTETDTPANSSSPINAATPRVCAVIVTYNRLALLKEAVAAVRQQSRKADHLIIVDNGSTDGTAEYLATISDRDLRIITQPNLGASGGFHTALQAGFDTGADWFWCMDDDTIPDADCLAEMLAAETRYLQEPGSTPLGWICSVIRWKDGALHLMNEPKVKGFLTWGANILHHEYVPAQWCSFVSVAFSRQAIARCGLPLKKMFIWYDDVEYTGRMTTAGFAGLLALGSRAEHRTATNYAPDVADLAPENLWRFRYAFRNEIVALKAVYQLQPKKLCFQFCKTMARRVFLVLRAGKLRYLPMAIAQGFQGLFFSMDIDFPQPSGNSLPSSAPAPSRPSIPSSPLTTSVL